MQGIKGNSLAHNNKTHEHNHKESVTVEGFRLDHFRTSNTLQCCRVNLLTDDLNLLRKYYEIQRLFTYLTLKLLLKGPMTITESSFIVFVFKWEIIQAKYRLH